MFSTNAIALFFLSAEESEACFERPLNDANAAGPNCSWIHAFYEASHRYKGCLSRKKNP